MVNPSVSLWTTPRETVHHMPTGGQPIVHENIMHILLFTSVILPPVYPGIRKYKSVLETKKVGIKLLDTHYTFVCLSVPP